MSRQPTVARLSDANAITAHRRGVEARVAEAFIEVVTQLGGPACETGNARALMPRYAQTAAAMFARLGGDDERRVGEPMVSTLRDVAAYMGIVLGRLNATDEIALACVAAFDLKVRTLAANY